MSFLNEAGIVFEHVTPQVDGVCCLRLKDSLVGYLLHFVEEEFHIFMDAKLKECLQPQVISWCLMTLKVEKESSHWKSFIRNLGAGFRKFPNKDIGMKSGR